MDKARVGLLVGGFFLPLLLLVGGFAIYRASLAAAPGPAALAAKPARPGVGNWSAIASFPIVTVYTTPGPSPLRLKRAGAVGYPPNGKLYVLGGRHGTDGEDLALQ